MNPTVRRWIVLCSLPCAAVGVMVVLQSLPTPKLPTPAAIFPTSRPAKKLEPADIAAPRRLKDGSIEKGFLELHRQFLARASAGPIGILFLGDSITQGWSTTGVDVWHKDFAADDPANFGIAGDRTQNLLWRIDNGELDRISPRVVVLLIGTNNTDYSWEEIARADEKIVREIRQKLPKSRLLLLGIFPREFSPADPVREKIRNVNIALSHMENGTSIRYLDIGNKFLSPTGTANMELLPDFLHPSKPGYQIWADAMRPLLHEMMQGAPLARPAID